MKKAMANRMDERVCINKYREGKGMDSMDTSVGVVGGNTCCICLTEATDRLHHLNEKYSDDDPYITLRIVLSELSGVDMSYGEGNLPHSLCGACSDLTRVFYRFRRLCQESHRLLLARRDRTDDQQQATSETKIQQNCIKILKSKKHKKSGDNINNTKKKNKRNKRKPKGTTKAQERLYGEQLWEPTKCSECCQTVENVPALLAHRSLHHSARFQCLHCGAGLTTSRGLEFHLRKHSGTRPEVCSTCGVTFSDPRTLMIHEKRHSGTLRHMCSLCGRSFASRKPLQRHLTNHHPQNTNATNHPQTTVL